MLFLNSFPIKEPLEIAGAILANPAGLYPGFFISLFFAIIKAKLVFI